MTIKIMSREEFQNNFIDADADFYEHLSFEQRDARYQKILAREYANYVDEQVRRIRSVEC